MNQPFSDSDPESEEFAVIEEESIATAAPETLYAGEPAVIEKGTQHLTVQRALHPYVREVRIDVDRSASRTYPCAL